MQQYVAAREAESAATKDLLSAMQSGTKDMQLLDKLNEHMTQAHNAAMDIWDQMQEFSLGK